jgi:excisionase family DNA binding protein
MDTSLHREHPGSASVGPDAIDGHDGTLAATNNVAAYLTVREVAAIARCEHKSVRRAIAAGRLRAFQPNNRLLIREDDAYGWIEGRPATRAASPFDPRRAASRPRGAAQSQRHGSVSDLRDIERKAV